MFKHFSFFRNAWAVCFVLWCQHIFIKIQISVVERPGIHQRCWYPSTYSTHHWTRKLTDFGNQIITHLLWKNLCLQKMCWFYVRSSIIRLLVYTFQWKYQQQNYLEMIKKYFVNELKKLNEVNKAYL